MNFEESIKELESNALKLESGEVSLEESIDLYEKALKIDKYAADAHYNRGLALCKLERYDEAIKDYTSAIELNPYYELAYYHRGLTYILLKKYVQAYKDMLKTVDINPRNKNAREKIIELQDYVIE